MVSFTIISVTLYTIAHAATWDYLSSLVIPTIWGVATSFTTALLLDSTVYARMRRHRGWSMTTFVVGNIVLHFFPLVFPPLLETRKITMWDGTRAAVMHITWAYSESHGTFVLDDVYVPMKPWMWYTCLGISTVTEVVLVPLVMS